MNEILIIYRVLGSRSDWTKERRPGPGGSGRKKNICWWIEHFPAPRERIGSVPVCWSSEGSTREEAAPWDNYDKSNCVKESLIMHCRETSAYYSFGRAESFKIHCSHEFFGDLDQLSIHSPVEGIPFAIRQVYRAKRAEMPSMRTSRDWQSHIVTP